MLWMIIVVSLVLWAIGYMSGFAGNLIHLLLIGGLVLVAFNLLLRRRMI